MTPASVDAVLQALSAQKRLDKNSVVVDFGCGSGNLVAVLRYGVKAYGIEKDEAALLGMWLCCRPVSESASICTRATSLRGDSG